MLDIYSIGDLQFLVNILNAIAAWAGTSHPAKLAASGAIIGVFVLCVQSIMNGGKAPQFQNFFIGILFFWFLMGPGVGVTVHDVYTGTTQNVGNVPLGVAIVGSVMSSVGYSITEQMEQMFSTPRMTSCFTGGSPTAECGFLAGLTHSAIPGIDLYLPGLLSLPASQQGNFRKTLISYMQDCTYTGISLDVKKIADIMKNSDPWAAMGFASAVYGTRTYIPIIDPPVGTDRTCSDAHTQIATYLNGTQFWDHIRAHIQTTMGTSGDPYIAGQDELNVMATNTGTPAENIYSVYMAKILGPLFTEAISAEELVKYNVSSGDITAAQALAQRNDQWYGEKRLFQTTIRPALTFFEGLFYALTPFMTFVIMIVPFGLKMIIRYLQTAVWIQCWMPMMAIVNMFAYLSYYKEFTALNTASTSVSSLYGVVASQSAASDWIAQANLLGSMVPALAMVAVYGSSIALTHMASQLKGSDHWDETQRNPTMLKTSPVWASSNLAGVHGFNAPGVAPSINVSDDLTASETSSQKEMESAQAAYQSSFVRAQTNGATVNRSASETQSLGNRVIAQKSTSGTFIEQSSFAINESMSGDDTTRRALAASMAGGVGWSTLAKAHATVGNIFETSDTTRITNAIDSAERVTGSTDLSAGLTESISHDHRNETNSVMALSVGESEDKRLQASASKVVASEASYAKAMAQRTRVGSDISNDIVTLGAKVVDNNYSAALRETAHNLGITDNSQMFKEKYEYNRSPLGYGMGTQQAAAAARLMSMDELGSQGNVEASNALVAIIGGINQRSDFGDSPFSSASANAGLAVGAGAAGQSAYDQTSNLQGPGETLDKGAIKTAVGTHPTSAGVYAAHNANMDNLNATGRGFETSLSGRATSLALDKLDYALDNKGVLESNVDSQSDNLRFAGKAATAASYFAGDVLTALKDGAGAGIQHISPEELARSGHLFEQAKQVGAQTPAGQKYVAEAQNILKEQQAGWNKMVDGGFLDKIEGAYEWSTASVSGFFNDMNLAFVGNQGQGDVEWDARAARISGAIHGMTSSDGIHQQAMQEATRHNLVGEQASLYADVRTSVLTTDYDPSIQSLDRGWDINNLKGHEWNRNKNGDIAMNDSVARNVIYAASTGSKGSLNLVAGYNIARGTQ